MDDGFQYQHCVPALGTSTNYKHKYKQISYWLVPSLSHSSEIEWTKVKCSFEKSYLAHKQTENSMENRVGVVLGGGGWWVVGSGLWVVGVVVGGWQLPGGDLLAPNVRP